MCTEGFSVKVALFFFSLLYHDNFHWFLIQLMHCDIIPLENWFDRAAVDAVAAAAVFYSFHIQTVGQAVKFSSI